MYKRFSFDELLNIQNEFIQHLHTIIKREIKNPRDQNLTAFLKHCFTEGDNITYFFRSDAIFRIVKRDMEISFYDELDKIEICCKNSDEIAQFKRIMQKVLDKKIKQTWQKTIEQILMEEFKTGKYSTILDKPYLVYDIETTVVDDLKSAKYLLGYAMYPKGDQMSYECVMQEDLKDFVDRMLAFDGYIVGFNQIWFDNPVSIYNVWYGQKEIDILNKKSIDLYVFFQQLTRKRIGLNKLSEALIWVTKTLSSGAEWEVLWKQYQDELTKGNQDQALEYLEEFKAYCKNDVRMTALVMFYFLHYKRVFYDGKEYLYSIEDFVKKSNHSESGEQKKSAKKDYGLFE